MGNVLDCCSVIAFRNLGFIEEDVLDRVRNPDLLGFTTCIDSEKSLLRFWLWLNFGLNFGLDRFRCLSSWASRARKLW